MLVSNRNDLCHKIACKVLLVDPVDGQDQQFPEDLMEITPPHPLSQLGGI